MQTYQGVFAKFRSPIREIPKTKKKTASMGMPAHVSIPPVEKTSEKEKE